MPGASGVLQGSAEGEGYVPNADFWSDGAYQADTDAAATQAGGEAFLGDLQGGAQIGSAGGMVGGIIGMVVGAIIGLVDAFVTKDAVAASLEEEAQRRQRLEEELKDTMDMRDEIEQNLAALLHPLEQKFRTNMRLFGAQSRAQGLTGAQGVAAQLMAEEQYRQQVGPHLPGILKEAKGLAREQAFQKLKAIEMREGILLEQQRLQLSQDLAAAEQRSQLISGLSSTAIGAGTLIGQGIQDAQGTQPVGSTQMGATSSDSGTGEGASTSGMQYGGLDSPEDVAYGQDVVNSMMGGGGAP